VKQYIEDKQLDSNMRVLCLNVTILKSGPFTFCNISRRLQKLTKLT